MNSLIKLAGIGLWLALPAAGLPVVNAGFETGTFSGWTNSGFTTFDTVDSGSGHTGSFGGRFGAIGTTSSLSQTFATVAGTQYTISYWLSNRGAGTNSFSTDFGGVAGQSFTNSAGFLYTQFTYNALAATNLTTLTFTFRNDTNFWTLDDVSVVENLAGAPELDGPSSAVPLMFLAVTLSLVNRRRQCT